MAMNTTNNISACQLSGVEDTLSYFVSELSSVRPVRFELIADVLKSTPMMLQSLSSLRARLHPVMDRYSRARL